LDELGPPNRHGPARPSHPFFLIHKEVESPAEAGDDEEWGLERKTRAKSAGYDSCAASQAFRRNSGDGEKIQTERDAVK
jgi:hypothetical protein